MIRDEQRHYALVLITMGLRDLARFKRQTHGGPAAAHLLAMHHYQIGRIGLAAAVQLISDAEDERLTDRAARILHARVWRTERQAQGVTHA